MNWPCHNMALPVFKKAHASILLLMISQLAVANPTEGTVVNGQVDIQYGAHTVIQQQSDSAIINWQDFSVGAGEHTQFIQPGSSSVTLNRVIGNNASEIMGKLSSNGQIFLVNPNGIVFGIHSVVDVGGLVATTSNITDENFNNKNFVFDQPGLPNAKIINYGHIKTIADQGLIVLVSPMVQNFGVIQAKLGKVALGAGDQWTLDPYGDNLITFSLHGTTPEVLYQIDHDGHINADGGSVFLTAQQMDGVMESIINVDGYIEARTVSNQQGKIVLLGPQDSQVRVAGVLDVSSNIIGELAGLIEITGKQLWIGGGDFSLINASGVSGGGTVHIGGDYQGKGSLPTALKTIIMAGAQILADATEQGNGGKVIVWSDEDTVYNGHISARGGRLGGDGGFVETSGKLTLDIVGGTVSTLATKGTSGTWLLDPTDYTIDGSTEATILAGLTTNGTFQILADQNIYVASGYGLSWGNNARLELKAGNNIELLNNSTITNTGAGSLLLRADSDANSSGTVIFNTGSGVNFSASTGTVDILYNPSAYTSATDYTPYVTAASGKFNAYMLVNTLTQLQNIQTNLAGSYALGTSINAAASTSMNGGLGFNPIGDNLNPFTGKFHGQGQVISGLYINRPLEDYVGLFGAAQSASFNQTTIVSSLVNGRDYVGTFIGKGDNLSINGNILLSTSAANASHVTGRNAVGGIYGSLNVSQVTGNTIAYGNVTGRDYVGGNVGSATNSVIVGNVFHFGNVEGNDNIGGVAGAVTRNVPIVGLLYQSGTVRGNNNVGGIAGVLSGPSFTYDSSTVALQNQNVGTVIGNSAVGGVAGFVPSEVTNASLSRLNNRSYLGITYLDNFISRDFLNNGQPSTGIDTSAELGFYTTFYRNLYNNSTLFTVNMGSDEISQKYAAVKVNAQSLLQELVSSDLFSGLFTTSFDSQGRPNLTMIENESPIGALTRALNASNNRMSTASIMAMGKGIGGLLMSGGGVTKSSFGGNMGANVLAMFGLVSMGRGEGGFDQSKTAESAMQAASSGFCGMTCKLILLSMQSPEELDNIAEDINVNPQLYVNSGIRPNSQMEQKYTWDESQNRYVATESLYKNAAVDASHSGTIIIRQPL